MSYYTPPRDRGHRYANTRSNPAPVSLSGDRNILAALKGEAVSTITLSSLTSDANKVGKVKVKNLQQIGSYSWVESAIDKPTIIVPGAPPEWINRPVPYKVNNDVGLSFCDQNGYRMPSMALYPLLKAVDVGTPSFDWSSVDFVTDRNGLRKLLRFIDQGSEAKDFRIDLQFGGKGTVLMSRWEKRNREPLSGFTFGFNFEKASTDVVKGCESATGHHRVISYDLCGLKMVVRFEVDASLPASHKQTKISSEDPDDLLSALGNLSLKPKTPTSIDASDPLLKVIRGGHAVSQDSLIEMTTRSEARARDFDWTDPYPQLFLSQTPNHFLGIHNRGNFRVVQKRRLGSPELVDVEERAQRSFRLLVVLLKDIKARVAKSGERGRLTLICQAGILKVFEREGQEDCLPDEAMSRFE